MRLSTVFGFGLFSLVALGCATAQRDAEPMESQESELASPCTWGTTCPDSLRVAEARDFGGGRPPARLRSDIVIATSEWEATPRVFRQHTTRPLRIDDSAATKGMVLTGPEPGSAFAVDNALVIEVLGVDGALIDAAYVGELEPATISGKPLRKVGGEHSGWDRGFRFAPVDITSLLPRNTAFRLRFSAIDNGGSAAVGDVWARTTGGTEPPPPADGDVFEASWCDGAPISKSQFLSHFAPGSISSTFGAFGISARRRDCHELTGCGAWEAASSAVLRKFPDANGWPTRDEIEVPVSGDLVGSVSTDHVTLAFAEAGVEIAWHAQAKLEWYDNRLDFADRSTITADGRGADVGTTNLHRDGRLRVNEHCLQLVRTGRDYVDGSGRYTEYALSFHARY